MTALAGVLSSIMWTMIQRKFQWRPSSIVQRLDRKLIHRLDALDYGPAASN